MAVDRDRMTGGLPPGRGPAKARVAGIITLVLGVIAAVVGVIALANSGADGALVGGGAVGVVVAVLAFLLTGYGFQIARTSAAALPASGPLILLSLLAAIVGVLGSMGAFVLSSAVASQNGVAVAIVVLLLAFLVTITGFVLVRTARVGSGNVAGTQRN